MSIAVCRSIRPSDSAASSGSCHGRPTGLTSQRAAGVRVGQRGDVRPHPRVDPRRAGLHVLRLRGQPLHQVVAGLGGDGGQLVQRRPRPFGVDVVRRQRRNAAPVVDARADQRQALVARHQVRRRLDAHLRAEHQPGDRDRGQEVVDPGVGRRGHRGVILGPEVLHDHFLDVPELLVRPADRVHGLGALGQRLADADQQAGGERDRQPAGVGQRAQPHLRVLVGAAVVRQPLGLEQPPRRGLQHHAHRRRDRLEPRQLRPAHHAGIQVRQQAGLLEHPDRHRAHVVQRRVVAALVEPLPRLGPARLGPVAEGEKCFLATEFGTATGDVEDLVGLHVHADALGAQLAGHGDEGAVVAGVAAQMRDRDEHLARVADRQPACRSAPARRLQTGVAHPRGAGAQIGQIVAAGGHRDRRLVDVQRHPVAGPPQHPPQGGGTGHAGLRRDDRAGQSGAALRVQSHSRVTPGSSRIIRASHNLKPLRLA